MQIGDLVLWTYRSYRATQRPVFETQLCVVTKVYDNRRIVDILELCKNGVEVKQMSFDELQPLEVVCK